MTLQPTIQAARSSQYSWFESIPEIGTFASNIIEGLGAFGLAANGMCPTLLEGAMPLQCESKLSVVGNEPTQ
jgi:hypothetical protein